MGMTKNGKHKNFFKWCILILAGVLTVLLVAFYFWAVIPYSVMEESVDLLNSDERVLVNINEDIVFSPASGNASNVGFIFYPGTRVDSEAYAPLGYDIAKAGHTAVLAQMPFDLSVLDMNRALKIMDEHPHVDDWVVSGHSMGGAMAAFFTESHLDQVQGLVFLGAYPSKDTILVDSGVKVVSLFGEFDTVASIEEIEEKKANLPADTKYVLIDGGNHAGFGWYGPQSGDGEALITRTEQQAIVSKTIIELMNSMSE